MEPPSQKLLERLTALNLCRRRDFRRCKGRVRRLARDLPAFDSVWIDALVQERRLSLFQARLLENAQDDRLAVGPCLLVEELGEGIGAATYLARLREGKERCVLKCWTPPAEERTELARRFGELAEAGRQLRSSAVVLPQQAVLHDGRLILLSRYVAGIPLTELLVRRGRFPARVVLAMARQLAAGLQELESARLVHGDISLHNVRLTKKGEVVLVDAGVASLKQPEVFIRSDIPPERYDGVAPERIATGKPATLISDLYALGCLLWQLLAGRPPFPTGDPLAKLAQHQTRDIPDVREWAPETPPQLAEIIFQLTRREPQQRPASAGEVVRQLGKATRRSRRRLRRFYAAFQTSVPRVPLPAAGRHWKQSIAAVLLAGLLAMGALSEDGFRWQAGIPLLRWMRSLPASLPPGEGNGSAQTGSGGRKAAVRSGIQPAQHGSGRKERPLPSPDSSGQIVLTGKGPYLWNRPVKSAGTITIRAAEGSFAIIRLTATARLQAPRVVLKNLRFVPAEPFSAAPQPQRANQQTGTKQALLHVVSRVLFLSDCRFSGKPPRSAETHRAGENRTVQSGRTAEAASPAAIFWAPLATSVSAGPTELPTQLRLEDVVMAGPATALHCAVAPSRLQCENVLYSGGGIFLQVGRTAKPGRPFTVRLRRLTLRAAGALMELPVPENFPPSQRVMMELRNCVLHFNSASGRAALCRFRTAFPGRLPEEIVQISGEGTLMRPGTPLAAEISPDQTFLSNAEVWKAVLIDGGLMAAPFEFAGPLSNNPADAVVTRYRAPLRSAQPPGIEAGRFSSPAVSSVLKKKTESRRN